ncbi:MAG: hypothetical protein CMC05_05320 [Flavobacteriaceae bacterium]|nr:hypothetical protein [Flavobacteriaceae bacterium]MBD10860.1 hypothetical protein [Flavobacteriaceae bacterium]|tara:strand:+ start:164 stop:361 length:198 start_codon:yes stop_codon:yes gene_type:complete
MQNFKVLQYKPSFKNEWDTFTLAVIHHISLIGNVPFDRSAEFFEILETKAMSNSERVMFFLKLKK